MDPLEDVLALLGTTAKFSTGLVAGGDWAIRFGPPAGVKFNTVRRGRCVLAVDDVDPIELAAGDCFLLTRPVAFTLASDLTVPAVPAAPLFAGPAPARAGTGEDVIFLGGAFTFGDRARALLLDELPTVIHVPAGNPEASSVERALADIETELSRGAMASTLVAEHLAAVMLIYLLRFHLAQHPASVKGWLAGLADQMVAAALKALHARPAHPWTVEELARVAAVSRSTMAARFKTVVGQGPLEYLTTWRIELASDRLLNGTETLATIARTVGYSSESALSNAFKRVTGSSPTEYRKLRPTLTR
jgi:AraC-like DNA-binding protein